MKPKKIGYGALGRTMWLKDRPEDPVAVDCRHMLDRLASRHPDVEWVVFTPSRETPSYYPNVTSPWGTAHVSNVESCIPIATEALADCDAAVVFVVSPMSASINHLPKLNGSGEYVKPLVSAARTSSACIHALNAWIDADPSRDPVYIINDPRTALRCRDLKWPPRASILAQFDDVKSQLHYRFGDEREANEFGLTPLPVTIEGSGHWVAIHDYEAADIPLITL